MSVRDTGRRFKSRTEAEIVLELRLDGRAPYSATVVEFLSPVQAPRVQPGGVIAVSVDPRNEGTVVLGL